MEIAFRVGIGAQSKDEERDDEGTESVEEEAGKGFETEGAGCNAEERGG